MICADLPKNDKSAGKGNAAFCYSEVSIFFLFFFFSFLFFFFSFFVSFPASPELSG